MNSNKIKLFFLFLIGAFAGIFAMYLFNNYKIEKKNNDQSISESRIEKPENQAGFSKNKTQSSSEIDELTNEKTVINYVKQNQKLPDYYLTKSEAKSQGWVASEGNLCDVLPGKAIGGDKFSNREKTLPSGNQYYEADVNYECGRRNADRIVFTKNGEVWLTHDHYKSFEKQ